MPDSKFYTRQAAIKKATNIQTALALSKLRLFDAPFVPTESTVKTELEAAETHFTSYPDGGYALTAFSAPLNDPAGGAVITSPLVNISFGVPELGDEPVSGNIGGYWIEDAGGVVREVAIYDPPRPLAVLGDGWQWVEQIVEGRNS